MAPRFSPEKKGKYVLYFFLFSMVLFAALFYQERVIFTDTAECLTEMFKRNMPNIKSRYVSGLAQILPYLGYKLGLPLRIIVFLYSLNFILIPVSLALISMTWFKELKTAWSIVFFYLIMSIGLFYYPVSELQIGLCFLLFYAGYFEYTLEDKASSYAFWILTLCFVPTIVFSHPLAILVFGAWIALQFFVEKKSLVKAAIVAVMVVATHLIKDSFFMASYDAGRASVLDNFKGFGWDHLDNRLGNEFFKAIREDYFIIPVLVLLCILAFIRLKKAGAAICFSLIILALWVLITVSFKDDRYSYYTEHMYQPITFIICLCTARYLSRAAGQPLFLTLAGFSLILSLNKIYYGKDPIRRRLDWFRACHELMETKKITKGVVGIERMDVGWGMESYWAAFYESLLVSALDGPEHTKTVTIVWHEYENREVINQGDGFITVTQSTIPMHTLPKKYFRLDTSHYVILSDVFPNDVIKRLSYQGRQ